MRWGYPVPAAIVSRSDDRAKLEQAAVLKSADAYKSTETGSRDLSAKVHPVSSQICSR